MQQKIQQNKQNESAQHLPQTLICFTMSVNKAILPTSNHIFYRIYAEEVYTYFTT